MPSKMFIYLFKKIEKNNFWFSVSFRIDFIVGRAINENVR